MINIWHNLRAGVLAAIDWFRFGIGRWLYRMMQQFTFGILQGMFDGVLLLFLGVGVLQGSQWYMASQYTLSKEIQSTAVQWAPVSMQIGLELDIPPEVPLVIWFKESSMKGENPASCTGIMGVYDLVRSGEHACFTPGPINAFEIKEQLLLGGIEFKKRCPEIKYTTHDPDLIQKCYLAYNAGIHAATYIDPDRSAYVMNRFDEAHQNMVYSDIELGVVVMESLGAWPVHLAIQSLFVTHFEQEKSFIPVSFFATSAHFYDWLWTGYQNWTGESFAVVEMEIWDERVSEGGCLAAVDSYQSLFTTGPSLNPVSEAPILTQVIHGCEYGLPGVDIGSNNPEAFLLTPISGKITTYTDKWYNSTIRIENDEWIVWLLHARSYVVYEGKVDRGEIVGIMGAVGNATGPHVHYTVYSKIDNGFVDPLLFLR